MKAAVAVTVVAATSSDPAVKAVYNTDFTIDEVVVPGTKTLKSLATENYALSKAATTDLFGRAGYFYYTDPYGVGSYVEDYCTKLATFYYAPFATYTVTNAKVNTIKAALKDAGLLDYAADGYATSASVSLGDTIEFYASSAGIYAHKVFNTSLAKIVKVVAADKKADYDYVVTVTGKNGTRSYASNKLVGFDAETMVKDTYVTLYATNNSAAEIAVAAPAVTGTRTAYGTGYAKFDGVQYTLLSRAWAVDTLDDTSKFDVYTDANGFVIGYAAVEAVETEINIFYVKDAQFQKGSAFTGTYAQLEVIYLDGTTEVVDMAISKDNKVVIAGTETALPASGDLSVPGKFYAYTLNEDGEVKALTAISALAAKGYNELDAGNITFTNAGAKVTVGSTSLYATGTTTVTTLKDSKAITVTGYKKFVASGSVTSKDALYLTKGSTLLAVYIIDADAMVSSDVTYGWYVKTGDTYVNADKEVVTEVIYNVDGTDTTYIVKGSTVAAEVKGLAKIDVQNGIATLSASTGLTVTENAFVKSVNGDYIIVGDNAVNFAKDVKFYDVTKAGSVTALDEITAGSVITYVESTTEAGKIATAYVTYAAPAEDVVFGAAKPTTAADSYDPAYAAYLEGLGYSNANALYHAKLGTDGLLLKWTYTAADDYTMILTIKDEDGVQAAKYTYDTISAAKDDHSVMIDLLNDFGSNHSGKPFPEGTYSYEIATSDGIVITVGNFTYEK